MRSLLGTFIQAVDAEIAFIEKNERDRTYELVSGHKDEKSTGTLYVFLLADPLRIPEDSSGVLKTGQIQIPAMVVAQEANRVWLLLDSSNELPEYFPSAKLVLNEVELLKKLRDSIADIASRGLPDLLPKLFGKSPSKVDSLGLPPETLKNVDGDDTRNALAQCLGSEVTFLWGPPGTGKTFSIATLVAALAMSNETVLVTSHTHAAVEQALWALIEPPAGDRQGGPLHDSEFLSDGRLLKVGPLKSERIPRAAHLDSLLEDRQKERQLAISTLTAEQNRIALEIDSLDRLLTPWRALHLAEQTSAKVTEEHGRALNRHQEALARVADAQVILNDAESELERAKRSFFLGRSGRARRAQGVVDGSTTDRNQRRAGAAQADGRLLLSQAELDLANEALERARADTHQIEAEPEIERRLTNFRNRAESLTLEIEALTNQAADDAPEILHKATAVFVTLTKLYIDRVLKDMTWDTVIIDEASMAMPPLVALAAARAKKRIVIAGDMYQLPPVVHSPPGTPAEALAGDIFSIRGITESVDNNRQVPELAQLMTQRRMHPAIASTARELIPGYRSLRDHPLTTLRQVPAFLSAIGTSSPLVVVDTTVFRPWSGKMPGSLSRFNFLSGQAAVEIASLYAAAFPEPSANAAPCIGVVTPYAAQRRYLARLVKNLGLENWVMCGTVHTFQGNECDVIIFDSVLGEPHWTSRMTNPHEYHQVRRDLNVAVTRARHQFVFVGDSKWLNKHAQPASAYGKLWRHLSEASDIIDAHSLLGSGFRDRVAASSSRAEGWGINTAPRSVALLTEASFYQAFARDLSTAKARVILYTPFIGKTRWPLVEPHIRSLSERGVDVYLLHKPLTDPEWRRGDPAFGRAVLDSLRQSGVRLIPISGVHSKTLIIDDHIVYDGSLNWASQTASYEHMWRFTSSDMAALVTSMLQLEPVV